MNLCRVNKFCHQFFFSISQEFLDVCFCSVCLWKSDYETIEISEKQSWLKHTLIAQILYYFCTIRFEWIFLIFPPLYIDNRAQIVSSRNQNKTFDAEWMLKISTSLNFDCSYIWFILTVVYIV